MKLIPRTGLICCLLPALLLHGQAPEENSLSREQAWLELESREDLDEASRREALTGLMLDILGAGTVADRVLRGRCMDLLEEWEGAPSTEPARQAYLKLLDTFATGLEGRREAIENAARYRAFLQKGLTLAQTPAEEGRLLYHLARSWLRSASNQPTLARRAELLLGQAADLLPPEPPQDAVHAVLGDLYRRWGRSDEASPRDGGAYLSRAVRHFRMILAMESARPELRESAASALEDLLKPQMDLSIGNRFLPGSDIRLSFRTRNIGEVNVTIRGLPPGAESEQFGFAELSRLLQEPGEVEGQLIHEEVFKIESRHPHDWHEMIVRPGVNLPAGWYGVTLEGEGEKRRDVLLVTPLEVAALARRNGDLLVWVCDGETGQPFPEAEASVLDGEGTLVHSFSTDADGLALLKAADIPGWEEIHLHSDVNPGHLRRKDLYDEGGRVPWVFVHPSRVAPGGLFQWSIMADPATMEEPSPGLTGKEVSFVLPDGTVLPAEAASGGWGWSAGELRVPPEHQSPGPLLVRLPDNRHLVVGHVAVDGPGRVEIAFSGDPLHPRHNLFLSSTPVGVQITPVFGSELAGIEFVRLRVTRLERSGPVLSGELPSGERETVILDEIIPFDPADQRGLYRELPEMVAESGPLAVKVEVLTLEGDEPLGRGWMGISPYEETFSLVAAEHLAAPGEPVRISYQRTTFGEEAGGALEGDFVVYRETWETRYVHRKRGTPLSEEEYLALPDRSLLGAAKTDYRLARQGYIREQVRRVSFESMPGTGTFSLALDVPGYYNIEFEPRDAGVQPEYPQGPLEVWVLSPEMDPRTFRSEEARLLLEPAGEDAVEVLILMGEESSSVLLDLEMPDGRSFSRLIRPEHNSVRIQIEEAGIGRSVICRALLTGGRQTGFLSATLTDPDAPDWKLEALDGFYGLNPGVPFEWRLETGGDEPEGPFLWTFLSGSASRFTDESIRWQRQMQLLDRGQRSRKVACLGEWLPFADPFTGRPEVEDAPAADPEIRGGNRVERFLALHPEVTGPASTAPGEAMIPFSPLEENGDAHLLRGEFPEAAGRWRLSLFRLGSGNRLRYESWPVSTELPIRSQLLGPANLRPGDIPMLLLEIENTTASNVRMTLSQRGDAPIRWLEEGWDRIALAPYSVRQLEIPAEAVGLGDGRIDLQLDSPGLTSETGHSLWVEPFPDYQEVAVSLVEPQVARAGKSFDLSGFSAGRLVVASSLGNLLPVLREAMAGQGRQSNPRIGAIRDWALGRAFARQGMEDLLSGAIAEEDFPALVLEQQLDSGGWSWMEGGPADPWLSAFILWSLDLFHPQPPPEMEKVRQAGRDYLATVLVDGTVGIRGRLMALRALAVRGLHASGKRPSRIEARTFLDLIRQRDRMDSVSLSMLLQAAKAYAFREEIELLAATLQERLEGDPGILARSGFRETSLYALALQDSLYGESGPPLLRKALEAFSRGGLRGGWEQLAGFLDLAAGFYWQGEFSVDGNAVILVQGAEPFTFSLNPQLSERGYREINLTEDILASGRVDVTVDASGALSPVYLAVSGTHHTRRDLGTMAGVGTTAERSFYEETLLKGTRTRKEPVDLERPFLEKGDRFLVTYTLPTGWSGQAAQFLLSVPAGLELSDAVFTGNAETPIRQTRMETANPLEKRLQVAAPGTEPPFVLELHYEARWSGEFAWPAPCLLLPRSGEVFRLGPDRRLRVGSILEE